LKGVQLARFLVAVTSLMGSFCLGSLKVQIVIKNGKRPPKRRAWPTLLDTWLSASLPKCLLQSGHSKQQNVGRLWIAISTYLLIAITKKHLHLDHHSLYEILQIMSLSMFETIPINHLRHPQQIQIRISSQISSLSSEEPWDTTGRIAVNATIV